MKCPNCHAEVGGSCYRCTVCGALYCHACEGGGNSASTDCPKCGASSSNRERHDLI